MANGFDPVGAFQRGRSNALAIRQQEQAIDAETAQAPIRNELAQFKLGQAKTAGTQQQTQFNQQQAIQRATVLNKTARALKGINPAQRAAAFQSLEPQLEQFGIPVGTFNPADAADDAKLNQVIAETQGFITDPAGSAAKFQKGATALIQTDEGQAFATQSFDPATGQSRTEVSPIPGTLISKLGETADEETKRKVIEAQQRAAAKNIAERDQDIITRGLAAADSTAPIRRGIELLEMVETGGIDRASLAAKRFFGIESGDEGELSNLLGKSVLSQLRETFGAAFTAKEGQQLEAIEAGFSKSPAANKRLLRNALRIAERSANRALDRAIEAKDFKTANDIQEALDFTLGVDDSSQGVQEGATATNPQTGEKVIFRNGQWQPI